METIQEKLENLTIVLISKSSYTTPTHIKRYYPMVNTLIVPKYLPNIVKNVTTEYIMVVNRYFDPTQIWVEYLLDKLEREKVNYVVPASSNREKWEFLTTKQAIIHKKSSKYIVHPLSWKQRKAFIKEYLTEIAKHKTFIFGLGTGRCGTQSLSTLLDSQTQSVGLHEGRYNNMILSERVPWKKDLNLLYRMLLSLANLPYQYVADIALYYLPYVSDILGVIPTAKIVCLKRDKDKVIESYIQHTPHNLWSTYYKPSSNKRSYQTWAPEYPKYKCHNIRKCIDTYWKEYYTTTDQLLTQYPNNIKLYTTEDLLNTPSSIHQMLNWIGFKEINVKIIHGNKTKK